MRLAVIGQGCLGTATGACLASVGRGATRGDAAEATIGKLQRGEPAMDEPHREDLLRLAAGRGGIDFSADAVGRAAIVVTEGRELRELDLKRLAEAMAPPIRVDGRRLFRLEEALATGFDSSDVGLSAGRAAAGPPNRHA